MRRDIRLSKENLFEAAVTNKIECATIARSVGVSKTTVSKYMKKYGFNKIVNTTAFKHSRLCGEQDIGGCIPWVGAKYKNGYGEFYMDGRLTGAHRASYVIHISDIPEGLFVLHTCDNKSCVNPDHLFLGTHQDNMDDMKKKGRQPNRKLSQESVKSIFSDTRMYSVIASENGVTESTIKHIKNGRSWVDTTCKL